MVPHLKWSPRLNGNWVDENRTVFLLHFCLKDWKDVLLISDIHKASFQAALCIGNFIPIVEEVSWESDELPAHIDGWIKTDLMYAAEVKCVYMYTQSKELQNCSFDAASFDYLTNPDLTNAPVTMLPLIEKFFKACNEGISNEDDSVAL